MAQVIPPTFHKIVGTNLVQIHLCVIFNVSVTIETSLVGKIRCMAGYST